MDDRTITLRENDAALATQLLREGHFASTAQVVEAAMEALRDTIELDRTLDWESVRAAAADGEAAFTRGDYVDLNSDAELKAHLDGIMARVQSPRSPSEARAARIAPDGPWARGTPRGGGKTCMCAPVRTIARPPSSIATRERRRLHSADQSHKAHFRTLSELVATHPNPCLAVVSCLG
jgi:hypothetical protein